MKFLSNTYRRCYSNEDYYSKINNWLDWYTGNVAEVSKQIFYNGISYCEEEMYRINMAKRVCEDWASSILADGLGIVISSGNRVTEKFVQGSKGNGGVLGSNNMAEVMSTNLERMFALGTCAFVADLDNVIVSGSGDILSSKEAKIKINTYTALDIIPLRYNNGIIEDVSFLSVRHENNKDIYILSTHIKENGEYVIYNSVLDSAGNAVPYEGILPVFRTRSSKPMFVILKTNISNNIDLKSPMGVSVYSGSTDIIKAIDRSYDAFVRDVLTGSRIILMNKKLLSFDQNNNPITPQDARKTYMMFFGDELDSDGGNGSMSNAVKETSFKLNVTDNIAAIQNNLNLLSSKVGLGTKFYNFNTDGSVTATEYVGERNDFIRNANKMKLAVTQAMKDLVLAIIHLGVLSGKNLDENAKVTVNVQDNIIESDSEERERDRQDVKDGIMSKVEYRMKWYGETEEEAKRKLEVIPSLSE